MLDYLRNLTKSDEDKRQELLTSYVDDALSPKQRQQVESDLAQDEGLTAEIGQMRLLQQQMRILPQRRVKRNFTLDPALYGCPQREPLVQAYPILRTATALAAFLFIFVLAANLFMGGTSGVMSGAEMAMFPAVGSDEMIAEAPVEEAAEAAMIMGEEAEPPEFEEVPVDPEFVGPLAEAESVLELEESDSAIALPLERDSLAGKPERNGAAAATIVAEEPAGAELDAETMMEADEASEPFEPSAAENASRDDVERSILDENQVEAGQGLSTENSLAMIATFLGIVLLILVILTLLARRRL